MKKQILIILTLCLALTGCGKADTPATETTIPATVETALPETTAPATAETVLPETTAPATEETTVETAPPYDIRKVDAYLAAIKEESDAIKHYLEFEAMSQLDMNEKSLELYELWDGALNYLWGELKTVLTEEDFESLLDQQRTWIADKEAAIAEAGAEVAGGSMYPLIINSVGAKWTEERVWELYALLQ